MWKRIVKPILFIIYIIFVIRFTLLTRELRTADRVFEPRLFWAFRAWIAREYNGKDEALQYIKNLLLFIPFGVLFPWKRWKPVLLASLLTSISIEATQYMFNIGWCEIDDVISNILGALIGFGLCRTIDRILIKNKREPC